MGPAWLPVGVATRSKSRARPVPRAGQTAGLCTRSSSISLGFSGIRRTCQAVTPSRRATTDTTVGRLLKLADDGRRGMTMGTPAPGGCCHRRRRVFDPGTRLRGRAEGAGATGRWAVDGAAAEGKTGHAVARRDRPFAPPQYLGQRQPDTRPACRDARPDSGPSDQGLRRRASPGSGGEIGQAEPALTGGAVVGVAPGTPWDRSAVRTELCHSRS